MTTSRWVSLRFDPMAFAWTLLVGILRSTTGWSIPNVRSLNLQTRVDSLWTSRFSIVVRRLWYDRVEKDVLSASVMVVNSVMIEYE